MKKAICAVLALVMALALVACSSTSSESSTSASTEASAESSTESSAEASTEASTEATTEASTESSSESSASSDGPLRVTLITMDQMSDYWVNVQRGAEEEVQKLKEEGVDLDYQWLAPERKDNAEQIQRIETAINDGSQAIVIAVNDVTACNDALQQALDAGIKLVYVDAVSDLPASATFATDNYEAGKLAGEQMLAELEKAGITEGMIGIVSAQAGVQTCIDRVEGFQSVFDGTNYTMSEVLYSDGDISKAQELANNLINDGCVGIFGANDNATTGMANAVAEANAGGKNIIAVGFDNAPANRDLVRSGALISFVAQNPTEMGRLGIEAAVKLLQGETLEETNVDTGASVVNIDNVDEFEDK